MTTTTASFRARLLARQTLVGTFLKTPTGHGVEIIGDAGIDRELHRAHEHVGIDAVERGSTVGGHPLTESRDRLTKARPPLGSIRLLDQRGQSFDGVRTAHGRELPRGRWAGVFPPQGPTRLAGPFEHVDAPENGPRRASGHRHSWRAAVFRGRAKRFFYDLAGACVGICSLENDV